MEMKDAEKQFLNRIRSALENKAAKKETIADLFEIGTAGHHHAADGNTGNPKTNQRKLLKRLVAEAECVNLTVRCHPNMTDTADAIAALIASKRSETKGSVSVAAWDHPLIRKLKLDDILGKIDTPVYYTPSDLQRDATHTDSDAPDSPEVRFRKKCANAGFGITSADFCIARTATLVMKTRPGQARTVSLLPPIHIAVIESAQVINDLRTLYDILETDPQHVSEGLTHCMTFITGPSRTRDIEGVMVFGAHGPREVYLFVITGDIRATDWFPN